MSSHMLDGLRKTKKKAVLRCAEIEILQAKQDSFNVHKCKGGNWNF